MEVGKGDVQGTEIEKKEPVSVQMSFSNPAPVEGATMVAGFKEENRQSCMKQNQRQRTIAASSIFHLRCR